MHKIFSLFSQIFGKKSFLLVHFKISSGTVQSHSGFSCKCFILHYSFQFAIKILRFCIQNGDPFFVDRSYYTMYSTMYILFFLVFLILLTFLLHSFQKNTTFLRSFLKNATFPRYFAFFIKRTLRSLCSFTFFMKERYLLCVLLRSL